MSNDFQQPDRVVVAAIEDSVDLFQLDPANLEAVNPELSISTPKSGDSSRSKLEEFALQRKIERLRSFYYVLQTAMGTLIAGISIAILTEVLWRIIPAGRAAEHVVSGFSALGWFLTSATVAITSTCPVNELNFNSFVHARPVLCIFVGLLPVTTAATRLWELPIPRWISCVVSILMLVHGCIYCSPCTSYRWLPSFAVLMEVWYLDVIFASTVNEISLQEEGLGTDVWLAVHATMAFALQIWLWWRRFPSTSRFYAGSYMAITWNSSYYACRGVDLALHHKKWEAGRQLDIAVLTSFSIAVVVLLPLLLVLCVGRKRLFDGLAQWLDQSRRLQDGAFMAMLLDSYVVEVGQPWWLSEAEVASSKDVASWLPKMKGMAVGCTLSVSKTNSLPNDRRPGFLKGTIAKVADDGKSFWVHFEKAQGTREGDESIPQGEGLRGFQGEGLRGFQVHRNQQVMPWRELLDLGRRRLRCVDWASQSQELWMQSSGPGFELSRPVGKGEVIDFFVSHSWSDSPEEKWRALRLVADSFREHHGRYPTFWIDKFCIDQRQIADGLRVLPVNVMACRQVLVLCGPTYPTRLWCAWELCVLLSFMPVQVALNLLLVIPLSEEALLQLTAFDCSVSSCYDPNEELRLRHVIGTIGTQRFERKIRALGQLIWDRELTRSKGLLVDAVIGAGSHWKPGEVDSSGAMFCRTPSGVSIIAM